MMNLRTCALAAAVLAGLCGAAAAAEAAPAGNPANFKTVHIFGTQDGAFTTGVVEGRDGNLYGLTTFGGTSGDGEAFRLTPDGVFDILHVFSGSPGDGENPYGRLIQGSDGNFYGTTIRGGAADLGTIFRLAPDGTYTVMHSFGAAGDSDSPFAGLMQARDGTLYGTTCSDVVGGFDAVFAMTPAGGYRIVYRFRSSADGYCPHGELFEADDGLLYGTTLRGGLHNGGTAFSVDAAGHVTTLHDFLEGSGDGAQPNAGLVDGDDGYLYGTTTYGGSSGKACGLNPCGTVFRTSLDGALDVLHSFGVTYMGAHPSTVLARIGNHRIAGTADWRDAKVPGTIFMLREQP